MKIHSLILSTGFICIVALTSSGAMAVTPEWYGGIGAGWSSTSAGPYEMHPNLEAEHAPTSTSVDDSDTGWKAFVGYQYNKNVAVELSYTALGTFTLDADITLPGIGTLHNELEPTAWCLSGVGTRPMQNSFSLNGRLGLCQWDDGYSGFHGLLPETPQSDGTGLLIGIGASYDYGNNVTLRAEWERYFDVIHDIEDADLISISIMTGF